jgi:alkanesulfonate monooxygenase SsuD/methylene tetrahydromethanopterin reductase-like flavin-dependent oxidoreductase (luciferase family)
VPAARLDDALHVIRDLLTGEPVTYEGRTITVTAPSLQPAMASPPPIYVGGRGEAALKRAARHGDMWLPMWLTPERVAERAQVLAELAVREGRPTPGIALLIGVHIDDDRARARAEAELHIRGQYRMGLDKIEHWTLLDSVDGAVEQLEAYRQAGVDEFVFMPLGREPLTQYERLAEVRQRFESAFATSGAEAGG